MRSPPSGRYQPSPSLSSYSNTCLKQAFYSLTERNPATPPTQHGASRFIKPGNTYTREQRSPGNATLQQATAADCFPCKNFGDIFHWLLRDQCLPQLTTNRPSGTARRTVGSRRRGRSQETQLSSPEYPPSSRQCRAKTRKSVRFSSGLQEGQRRPRQNSLPFLHRRNKRAVPLPAAPMFGSELCTPADRGFSHHRMTACLPCPAPSISTNRRTPWIRFTS
ncbi:hypothetical protein SKAU_G00306320 [Synaphobranchus kaupii]|uniref:Uncharacterized protein n=1 Tax=Synaphobranchus kaupii TaxID=118154 RepID=A0A9Q1IKL0_SYNKA|nr:hypothetical protein SKAU_G00306320 [Synaphobranchus kaupii]